MVRPSTLLVQSILAAVVLASGFHPQGQLEARAALSNSTAPSQCKVACDKVTGSLQACAAGDPKCNCEDLTGDTLATCLDCVKAHNPDATVNNPENMNMTDVYPSVCQAHVLRKGGGVHVGGSSGALSVRPSVLGVVGLAVAAWLA
ncbi:hypothetical protein E1B28_008223 [Marasmius oreades]|uniref:Extracellular membrane protein CFEM domain-containing protein n=1 Tax=Marasmius oreades TaxID=181124 RepID=A0A9P7US64_9AGAR|nr:uncharacterized protein E1B28_008223 [Marasmius oreades]KAG7091820.1 hypothetical protein E1B28_008223 [Marasmius oreades]